MLRVNQPRMNRLVLLLLVGIMLCCFGVFSISLPHSAPDVPSALAGTNVGQCG